MEYGPSPAPALLPITLISRSVRLHWKSGKVPVCPGPAPLTLIGSLNSLIERIERDSVLPSHPCIPLKFAFSGQPLK